MTRRLPHPQLPHPQLSPRAKFPPTRNLWQKFHFVHSPQPRPLAPRPLAAALAAPLGAAASPAAALVLATFLATAPPACAEDADEDLDVLSSRYGTLEDLANSSNADSDVVVDTRIGVLVAANQALDGAEVRFEGEAIGEEVAASGGRVWVALSATSGQSISVLMDADDAEVIDAYGDYDTTGATVRVRGTYHVACDDHAGELDVHASEVELVTASSESAHDVSARRLETALALAAAGVVLVVAYLLLRRRMRRR